MRHKTVSPKQLEANRRNALRSTGPRTFRGKSTAALNAVKSGLFAKHCLITAGYLKEEESEFNRLLTGLNRHFRPQGMLESLLVEKVAGCAWRSRRVLRYEAGQIRDQLDSAIAHEQSRWPRDTSHPQLAEDTTSHTHNPESHAVPPWAQPRKTEAPAAATNSRLQLASPTHQHPWLPARDVHARLEALSLPSGRATEILLRHAANLDRELYRALNHLERVQRQRKGELLPPPVSLNIAAT